MFTPLFRRAGLLATAFLLIFIAGCSKKEVSTETANGKVLRIGNGAEPEDIDPQVVTGVGENKIITALIEGLVTYSPDGGIAPGVAETWEISADGLLYTFHLRDNAKWSNGDPVTAQDFVRSFQRMLTPSLGAEYAYKLFHLVNGEEFNTGKITDFAQVGAKALDARTLQLTLKHRTPFLLESLKHYAWFPVHIPTVEKFGGLTRKGSAWTRPGNYVGNGPFNLVSWKPNQKITVTRSATYWDHATVKLDGIEFYAIDKDDTEERLFRTGELDYSYTLPLNKIETYRREHQDTYRQTPYYGVYFYRLNTTRKPLDDKRVRRALALAIDRESLIKNILRSGGQSPALNFTPPSDKFTSNARIAGDLDEAKRLLVEAGYPEGKNMPPVEILFNTSESHRVIAEAIQQMWKTRLGVNALIVNQEWKVYLNSQQTLNYQVARAGWIGDYDDPNTFLDMWVTGGGNNQTGWSNAEYDRLLHGALATPTEEARMAVYQKLEAILADEVPVIPIYFYSRIYAISPKVKNWITTPLDNRAWKWVDLAD
ncbi:peptide ABC transporter substrate-binding protein [Rariglobus hedericola]|uniref:Peptide ABC transporter substrate-binding protein n=1 Tax=Rariglobus hedericola TaxID=2597822 RepID=A0A556QQ22_9BACT|nr:peptide ABC transporter substrate-binding protein [Rariglobus hedericola]TSJ78743.1 peptide ABC transporter substrate-binding protein [Rariglobus hedericola]